MRLEELDERRPGRRSPQRPWRRPDEAPARDRGASSARTSSGSSSGPRASPRSVAATSRRCRPCAAARSSTSSTRRAPARAPPSSSPPSGSPPTSSPSSRPAPRSTRASRSRTRSPPSAPTSPAAIVIRSPARGRGRPGGALDRGLGDQRRATASTSIRARRCSTSTRCASASGSLEGKKIWIVGDVLHSRVARSNVLAFRTDGRRGDASAARRR